MPVHLGRIIDQRRRPNICRLHKQPFLAVLLHCRRPPVEHIVFGPVLSLIVLLAKLLYGFSVDDDQLVVGIHDIRLVVLMPIDRHRVKSEIGNSFSRHFLQPPCSSDCVVIFSNSSASTQGCHLRTTLLGFLKVVPVLISLGFALCVDRATYSCRLVSVK